MRPFRLNRLAMTNGKAIIIIQAAMDGLMAAFRRGSRVSAYPTAASLN